MDRTFFEEILVRCAECPEPSEEKKAFERYEQCIVEAVNYLSLWLFRYYHKKAFIFIDEYDTPIQSAYINHYYDNAVELLRSFFTTFVKANQYLSRSLFTGITKIAKETLFSDMNQLRECTMMDDTYANVFGFTEDEMKMILEEYGIADRETEIRY